jgi:hypothetical protein
MHRSVTQPTKEQVRAYMVARGQAHRPPPAPDDIRRQLGWTLASPKYTCSLISLCMLPATLGQVAAQAALDLCLAPLCLRPHTVKQAAMPA